MSAPDTALSDGRATPPASPEVERIDYLDAVRAFALILGIVFHAALSFMPFFIGWAVMDVSTSPLAAMFVVASHSFRMEVFFLIAGFFGHMAFHRRGAGAYLGSRFVRIVVPFVVGWFLLRPLLVSGWVMGGASLRGEVDIAAGLIAGFASLASLPEGIFAGSHLWFLYYLTLVTLLILVVRHIVRWHGGIGEALARAGDGLVAWMAGSRLALMPLVVSTAAVLWFMDGWGMDTPDKVLQPHWPVLTAYAGCFALGWILHRHPERLEGLSRVTVARCALAGTSLLVVVRLIGIQADPGHEHYTLAKAAFVVSYATMMWTFVFLTIGAFRKLCRRPSAIVRYVADSSYWMYLIHLPLVVWLQVAVAEIPVHWTVKLIGISAVTILVALLTYDLLVRSTIIGRVLNGRRRPRAILVWAKPAPVVVEA